VAAALALAKRGLSLLRAKRTIEALVEHGDQSIHLPTVEDIDELFKDLRNCGVAATFIVDAPVDVRAIRTQLGMTQEDFARRFNVELSALRNWEQGRYAPDRTARSYFRVIQRSPREASAAQESTHASVWSEAFDWIDRKGVAEVSAVQEMRHSTLIPAVLTTAHVTYFDPLPPLEATSARSSLLQSRQQIEQTTPNYARTIERAYRMHILPSELLRRRAGTGNLQRGERDQPRSIRPHAAPHLAKSRVERTCD
jgi:transcriptional regulator with XRE-family HTH domain